MPVLDCVHDATLTSFTAQVCVHLLETRDGDYFKVFTGQEHAYNLACSACCAEQEPAPVISWRSVCSACFGEIETEGCWDGIRGTPQVLEEPSHLRFVHRHVGTGLKEAGLAALRLVQPVRKAQSSQWIGLTNDGALVALNLDGISDDISALQVIATITASEVDFDKSLTLTCSDDGAFVCLTETHGDRGIVIERNTGGRTLTLTRDGYHSDVTPFPAAFLERNGQTLLIHSTAWNRLDVSDPATGRTLTERAPTSYTHEQERPLHYLDYFHGSLLVSPNQDYVADDGWVWHPVGVVRTWSTRHWLEGNVWEADDGPSVKSLAWRSYYWGGPLCWTDDTTLAVWGYGEDDLWLLPAVRLFDVVSGEEKHGFFGPQVASMQETQRPSDNGDNNNGRGEPGDGRERLFFDRFLFAVSKDGVSVWNVERGSHLLEDATLAPRAYHPATKEFLSLLPNGDIKLSRLVEAEH